MNALEGAAVNTAASVAKGAGAGTGTNAANTKTPTTTAAAAAEPAATNQVVAAAADPGLTEQATQIATLQGLGKEIAPRAQVVDVHTDVVEIADDSSQTTKRDLSGFDRALTFAEAALTKGPKIELGTGEGGSGVGITVDNGKRDLSSDSSDAAAPRRRAKVTTMYVRSGIPACE